MSARKTSLFRQLLAVCFVFAALVRPAAAVDWTDIWWNPTESGWGVNFINSDNYIFATFFLYDSDKHPIWYTGQMTVDGNGVWSGPLYLTEGTYFGNPWNTANDKLTQVGTVTFNPNSSFSGTLTYNVTTTNVTKQIRRQTLKTIPLGGNYSGALVSVFSNCNDQTQNGAVTVFVNYAVTQNVAAGTLVIDMKDPSTNTSTCKFTGGYFQEGLLYDIPNAAYTCSSLALVADVSQIKSTAQGFEGQWRSNVGAVSAGCVEQGYWSAVFTD